jgi:hypothetical protein
VFGRRIFVPIVVFYEFRCLSRLCPEEMVRYVVVGELASPLHRGEYCPYVGDILPSSLWAQCHQRHRHSGTRRLPAAAVSSNRRGGVYFCRRKYRYCQPRCCIYYRTYSSDGHYAKGWWPFSPKCLVFLFARDGVVIVAGASRNGRGRDRHTPVVDILAPHVVLAC